jgi:hypothetical protein
MSRLILGGGFGWLSGEFGLTTDNVVQVSHTSSLQRNIAHKLF